MNSFEGVEKAAAGHEAREAVGGQQHNTSKTNEVRAALMLYLTSEQHRERAASSHATDGDQRKDSDTPS